MKTIYLSIIVLLILSCTAQKNNLSALPLPEEPPKEVYCSSTFRLFWLDLYSETKDLKSMKRYEPSQEMIERHAVSKQGKTFTISGYLKVKPNFNAEVFKTHGGTLVKFNEEMFTFTFPIASIDKLFAIEGIEAIEMANKVRKIQK